MPPLFVSLLIAFCVKPLWTPHAIWPTDADLSCYIDQNGTLWCAPDVCLLNGTDYDDSY